MGGSEKRLTWGENENRRSCEKSKEKFVWKREKKVTCEESERREKLGRRGTREQLGTRERRENPGRRGRRASENEHRCFWEHRGGSVRRSRREKTTWEREEK